MQNSKIGLVFMGSDDFSVSVLKRLLEDPLFEVLSVVTPPDAPVGRDRIWTPCPLKKFISESGLELPIFDDFESIRSVSMDFLVVASYGVILPQWVLDVPKVDAINVHGSLLPKYRGASCVQQAILNGDKVTGVSVMKMVAQLDAGAVFAFSELVLRADHTGGSLRHELAVLGGELLAQTLPGIFDGSIDSRPQDESQVVFCSKITRESGRIDWKTLSAEEVDRRRRAFDPWPGIFTTWNGKRLKLLRGAILSHSGSRVHPGTVLVDADGVGIQCESGVFQIDEVQLEGKRVMDMEDFMRGYPDFEGAVLGQ